MTMMPPRAFTSSPAVVDLMRGFGKDLNLIYSQRPDNGNRPPDELISGAVTVKVTEEQALNAVLSEINKTADDVEEYHVFILPSRRGESKAVYAVTVKLVGEDTIYKYEVDCQTGEVTTAPTGAPPNEGPQNGGGFEDIGGNPPEEVPNENPHENPNENPQTEPITPPNGTGGNKPQASYSYYATV